MNAATIIQSCMRCFVGRHQFLELLSSIIVMQSLARTMAAKRKRICHRVSLLLIQRTTKRYLAKIQSEKVRANMSFAACKIQCIWRVNDAKKLRRKMIAYIIKLQSWTRSASQMNDFSKQKHATLIIQRFVRRMLVVRKNTYLNACASEIQRYWRGYANKIDFMLMYISTVKIQSFVRGSLDRQKMAREHMSVIKLQCLIRKRIAKNICKKNRIEDNEQFRSRYNAAMKIQSLVRPYVTQKINNRCACTIQCSVRVYLAKNQIHRMNSAILSIQSFYRGQKVRKYRSKRASKAANRIGKANKKARLDPKSKLGARTSQALRVLLKSKRLGEVIRAVATLELSTRLSIRCCQAYARVDASVILYALVRTCNRSLPHIELIEYVLMILSNVARHTNLIHSLATNDAIEVLIDMIQMFRDKEMIFSLAAQILEIICASGEFFLVQCGSRENFKRLKGIRALIARQLSTGPKNKYQHRGKSRKQQGYSKATMKNGVHALDRILSSIQASNAK